MSRARSSVDVERPTAIANSGRAGGPTGRLGSLHRGPKTEKVDVVVQLEVLHYPDAVVPSGAAVEAFLVRLDARWRLAIRAWPQRDARRFDATASAAFSSVSEVAGIADLRVPAGGFVSVQQTFYDRSSGGFRVRWVLHERGAARRYVAHDGADTSAFAPMKRLMPRFEELVDPAATMQVTLGNQGDLLGNFHLCGGEQGWRLFAACDEPWTEGERPALVEARDGTRRIGQLRLDGDPATATVHSASLAPLEGGAPIALEPRTTRFALVAYALVWEGRGGREELARHYAAPCDLRHVFRFPFAENRPLLQHALAADPRLLRDAFAERMLAFPWPDRLQGAASDSAVLAALVERHGYRRVSEPSQVERPGDFAILAGAIRIRLLRARYPLSALVVGDAPNELALVTVRGASGQAGACYWTIADWLASVLGWEPVAVFALDNGSDTSWRLGSMVRGSARAGGDGRLVGGREHVNAVLNVLPAAGRATHPGGARVRAV